MTWWEYLLIGVGSLAALYIVWLIVVVVFIGILGKFFDRFFDGL